MSEALVRRGPLTLRPDPRRVIAKLFLPGQETLANGLSRADAVIGRVMAMSDALVSARLEATLEAFADRHLGLPDILERHYRLVSHRMPDDPDIGRERELLIGAYFTQEYAIESAAVMNPSMVAHPDQSGLAPGELRFLLSVRAVGEGHVSSIEFRTGVVSAQDVRLDEPGRQVTAGRPGPRSVSKEFLQGALTEQSILDRADDVLRLLPVWFDADDLDRAIDSVRRESLTRGSADAAIDRIRWIVDCNYEVKFPADRPITHQVLYPYGPDESHGLEDARFTRFVDEAGAATYFATYTAYNGVEVAPHLIHTDDFRRYEISQLIGPAAKNKGMAIFPRRFDGRLLALSRWDRESIGLTSSADGLSWGEAVTLATPRQPWEVIQIGNCGPPIETDRGWLVLTHGVGAMRVYGLGAMLLDRDDPRKVLGILDEPFLTPSADEREGYVPNVVYSCGALAHDDTLVIPYGCSDQAVRFAFVDLPKLLERLS